MMGRWRKPAQVFGLILGIAMLLVITLFIVFLVGATTFCNPCL